MLKKYASKSEVSLSVPMAGGGVKKAGENYGQRVGIIIGKYLNLPKSNYIHISR